MAIQAIVVSGFAGHDTSRALLSGTREVTSMIARSERPSVHVRLLHEIGV